MSNVPNGSEEIPEDENSPIQLNLRARLRSVAFIKRFSRVLGASRRMVVERRAFCFKLWFAYREIYRPGTLGVSPEDLAEHLYDHPLMANQREYVSALILKMGTKQKTLWSFKELIDLINAP